jgi:hypothetical protein
MKTGDDYLFLLLGITGVTFIINRKLWREEEFELAKWVEGIGTVGVGVVVFKIIVDTINLCLNF